jgi:hypothetical protein
MRLINALARQLDAELRFERSESGGTQIDVIVPEAAPRAGV